MLVGEYLTSTAQRFPTKEALVCGSTRLTYKSLSDAACSLSSFLIEHELRTGDRVAVFLDNSLEAVISIFGLLDAGAGLVYIHSATPVERMGYILNNCSPRFLIGPANKLDHIRQAEKLCSKPPIRILTGLTASSEGELNFEEACTTEHRKEKNKIIDLDIAAIIYTSGSTGKPKGATLTHRNVDTVVESVTTYLEHTSNDIILDFLPLSIGYGLLQLLVTFRNGGTLVLEKGFGFPYEIVKKLKEEKVTGFAGVPTVWSILIGLKNLEKEDLSSLRYITNAAAAMPQPFIPRLRQIFPKTKIYLMHGLTECFRTTYLPPDQIGTRSTSVGKGMPNVELWVEDANGNRLPPGVPGEMVVRGSNIMQGYWNDPEATARVLRPGPCPGERVLHTGDLFMMDEDGYFHFVARMDDVIKSRGKKISPLEIEDTIYLREEVQEVRVIGVPDVLLGQAIKAEIVLKKGASLTDIQVKAHCKNHLEDFQIPHIVEFVASLPKSAGGKIKRVA